MKNGMFSKLLPHLVAIICFLVVSCLFNLPALQGDVLSQHDIVGWKGMSQGAFEYKERTGHFPLWNTNLFSGMPNYQVAMEGKSIMPDITKIITVGLPKPANFFLLASICFYLLCIALRINPYIGIFGSLAFAFSTYNPVIINAGHETKMLAIAYLPALLAGIIHIYEKRYWIGIAIATLAAYMEIGVNHPQVNYYGFIIIIGITIAYFVQWIRQKEYKHMAISLALAAVAAIAGVAGSALALMTTYEYSKSTMRGGKNLEVAGGNVTEVKTSGLDTDYAFQYSNSVYEIVTMLMPTALGGSSGETLDENSAVVSKLVQRGIPESNAIQLASGLPKYWGGLESTSGPVYYGVLVTLLALIGFVIIRSPMKWALLSVSVLGILMSFGKNLEGFNTFLFEYLPMYNKFRAPSMALIITQVTIPVMAVITLHQVLFRPDSREYVKAHFKTILYTLGGLFVVLGLMYLSLSYTSPIDAQVLAAYTDEKGSDEMGRLIVSGLKEDRAAMFGGQIIRALLFALVLLGILYLYMKKSLNAVVVIASLAVITVIEMLVIDSKYLNEDNYRSSDELAFENFNRTPVDEAILQDKDPNFRVFNSAPDAFNEARTSYFHKSIGGYHAAKLRIYQDVIEGYIAGRPNMNVLNMLNTKYFIVQDQQSGQPSVIPNPDAAGNAWFVKNVKLVNGPAEEFKALETFNPKDTVIIQNQVATGLVQPQWDSSATIQMTRFDNDTIEYTTQASSPQFAVFSEIYYADGWNAYVDGVKTPYYKVNYLLRGMNVPAGNHKIIFIFEPASYKTGNNISFIASIFILLIFIGGLAMAWVKRKRELVQTA